MNLADYAKVQQLVEERAKVTGKLGILNLSGHKLTSHFNVHFSGSAQPAEIAEIAAGALRTYYRDQLTSIDVQLAGLGVKVDGAQPAAPVPDPLASLRPEKLMNEPYKPAGIVGENAMQDPPEVQDAVMTIIRYAARLGQPMRFWEAKNLSAQVEGYPEPVVLGSFKLTVQRTA